MTSFDEKNPVWTRVRTRNPSAGPALRRHLSMRTVVGTETSPAADDLQPNPDQAPARPAAAFRPASLTVAGDCPESTPIETARRPAGAGPTAASDGYALLAGRGRARAPTAASSASQGDATHQRQRPTHCGHAGRADARPRDEGSTDEASAGCAVLSGASAPAPAWRTASCLTQPR